MSSQRGPGEPATGASAVQRLGRGAGQFFGAIPGWYMVLVEPWARRATGAAIARSATGANMELRFDQFVERKHWYRSYERRELALLRRVVRAGDVVLDVGANVGVLTVDAARLAGSTGTVVAIEPVPANVERLRRNVELNDGVRVEVLPEALGDQPGTLTLDITEHQAAIGNAGSYTASTIGGASTTAFEVPVTTVDDVVARFVGDGIPVRLVKIDVEGMETSVLRGAAATLAAHRAHVVIMEWNLRLTEDDPLELLAGHGYRLHLLGSRARLASLPAQRDGGVVGAATAPTGLLSSIASWIRGDSRLHTLVAVAPDVVLD